MNRRNFLIQSGLAATGTLLSANAMAGCFKKNKIGIQLYSLRGDIAEKGLEFTLNKIAAAGYNSVEMYGYNQSDAYFKNTASVVKKWLKANKLVSPSGHYMLDLFDSNGQQTIDAANELGHKYIVIPWFPENQRKSLDDYRSIAQRINKAAMLCKENNIKMAYHNHEFEFIPYEGGVTGFDILMKECDPTLVNFEMDIFWVVTAGKNPLDLFEKYPGRFKMWHVKDMDKKNPKMQTEVGSGSIDFKPIFAKAKLSGLEYFYVEQENFEIPSDESIRKSIAYVKGNLL